MAAWVCEYSLRECAKRRLTVARLKSTRVYAIGRSPEARGREASQASTSDAYQRTARLPTRIGSGEQPTAHEPVDGTGG